MSPAASSSPRELARSLDLEDYDAATRHVTLAELGIDGDAGLQAADSGRHISEDADDVIDGDSSIFRADAADATREMTSWEREQQEKEAATEASGKQQGRKAKKAEVLGSRLPVRSSQQRREEALRCQLCGVKKTVPCRDFRNVWRGRRLRTLQQLARWIYSETERGRGRL